MRKIVVFYLGNQPYGLDIHQVNSIEQVTNITDLPQTHRFIKGVINLRGVVVPVIDLKERLDLGETALKEETKLLIIHLKNIRIGLLVDQATDVIDIDESVIDSSTKAIEGSYHTAVDGIAKLENGLLILLNIETIFKHEEIAEVEEVIEA